MRKIVDMEKIISSLIQRRRRLLWSQKVLSEKTNVPLSAISRIERGLGYWEDYIAIIDKILSEALNVKPKGLKEIFLGDEVDGDAVELGKVRNTKNGEEFNIKEYFPNISIGEFRVLFGEDWKRSREGKQHSESSRQDEKKKQHSGQVNQRLAPALEYARSFIGSIPKKRRAYFKQGFVPNYNPVACKWFMEFDRINNTQGLYATNGGEFFLKELGYFLDYFNPELKLIMEWDEEHHYMYDRLLPKDLERHEEIRKFFPDYKIVRIRERDFYEFLNEL